MSVLRWRGGAMKDESSQIAVKQRTEIIPVEGRHYFVC